MDDDLASTSSAVEPVDDEEAEEEYISPADAGRMGKAVEHLVAASCILSTRGALNVSTSLVDDEGVDLVFHARGSTKTLAVQVKARMSDSKTLRENGRFVSMVRLATFEPRNDLAMLFVLADVTEGRYSMAWLVPSHDFAKKTSQSLNETRRRFLGSAKSGSHDQWAPYRHTPATLPHEILRVLMEEPL